MRTSEGTDVCALNSQLLGGQFDEKQKGRQLVMKRKMAHD